MLTRYHKAENGKLEKKALIYTAAEHSIDMRDLDPDAVRIVRKLRENGHEAYIVGGAVRDLLLAKRPKDYDIVTDAPPPRIKKIFYRSRIIGRRFRLVHVYAGQKIYEVSTFRSIGQGTIGNEYGTIDEDALRRDFSINALYYDPVANHIVDYVQGMRDIKAKRIVPVISLKTIFSEDPVRMIRAIKYSVSTGFSIAWLTRLAIRRTAPLLRTASVSRLGEEAIKIISSAKALSICLELHAYGLLGAILPAMADFLDRSGPARQALCDDIQAMDDYVNRSGDKTLGALLTFLLRQPVLAAVQVPAADTAEAYRNALQQARAFLDPITLPRIEVEAAVRANFSAPEPKPKLHKPRKRRRRHKPHDDATGAIPPAALDT